MSIEDTIRDSIIYALNKEREKQQDRSNTIHVSDIIQCLRKSFFDKKLQFNTFNLSMLRGKAMHDILLKHMAEYLNGKYEVEVKHTIGDVNIIGTVDLVFGNNNIIELKTAGYQYNTIPTRYIYQVQAYLNIIRGNVGYLVIIHNNDIRIHTIYRDDAFYDILCNRAIELYNSLHNNTIPKSRTIEYSETKYDCKYCAYKDLC